MKSISLISFVLLFSVGIIADAQPAQIVDAHFEALKKHDVKAIVTGYSTDAQLFSSNWEGAKTGNADITEVYTRYFASTPDLAYQVKNVINAGVNVIVEYSVSGTLLKMSSVSGLKLFAMINKLFNAFKFVDQFF